MAFITHRNRILLKRVFFIIGLLIIYGSLYPFDFCAAPSGIWREFLDSWHGFTGRGDALSNILLFVPFGYFGVLAYGRKAWLIAAAVLLAVGVQVLQVYLPSRDPNLQDALWNMLGMALGAGVTLLPMLKLMGLSKSGHRDANAALLLIGCWLAYRLMPFVPSLDWQQFKKSLKPLLLEPQLSYIGLLHDAVAWAVTGYLLSLLFRHRQSGLWLLLLVGGVFSLEVLIVKNAVSLTNVLGAAVGIGLWVLWLQRANYGRLLLGLSLMVSLLLSGLAPFEWRGAPGEFYWMPFHGFLGGSMMINISVVFEKGFFYGALILLLQQESGRFRVAVVSAVLLTLVIEIGQMFTFGHTAEITDPVLVLLIAMALKAVSGDYAAQRTRRFTEEK